MKRTTAFIGDSDRYIFDCKVCKPEDGWAQLDTTQDAWYFGNWINPLKLKYIGYAEGDVTTIEYESPEEFREEIEKMCKWYEERDEKRPGIDAMLKPELIKAFTDLGLAHWLH